MILSAIMLNICHNFYSIQCQIRQDTLLNKCFRQDEDEHELEQSKYY